MIEFKQEQIPPIQNEILLRVIELNETIAKQNFLIVQALSLPAMIIKGDQKND